MGTSEEQSVLDWQRAIEPLPAAAVARMAAGEVIDSWAAVVREVAENALDAGATRLHLEVEVSLGRLRLTDNGAGLTPDALAQAARPHTTSKIHNLADLDAIHTLGFRGQALHSLAQLAHLEIHSRPAGGAQGWRAIYDDQGHCQVLEPVPMAAGTVVVVEHLFAPWPQRQAALPSPAQQVRQIQRVLEGLALCHPQVTWQVRGLGHTWALWPGTAAEVLAQVVPQTQGGVRQTRVDMPAGSLEVVLALPDYVHRPRPDRLWIAVNGRPVQMPELVEHLLGGLRRSLPRGRFPIALIQGRVPPAQVDWHRHPAKTEVYLQHLDQWQAALTTALEQVMTLEPQEVGRPAQVRHWQRVAEAQGEARYRVQGRTELKAVAQIHRTYILAEHPAGLWLVEQHIAHERVLYEQLQDAWQVQPLETPLVLTDLTDTECQNLARLHLEAEPFGPRQWAIRQAPALFCQRPIAQPELAARLRELSRIRDWDSALVAVACRSALRNGTPLELAQLQELLDAWQQTRFPRTCPHGRPICLTLEETQLARLFRRHWVIGKSHGI